MSKLLYNVNLGLLVVGLLLCGSNVNAQSKSNKGKDFWIGFMKHKEGSSSKTSLYITADSNTS